MRIIAEQGVTAICFEHNDDQHADSERELRTLIAFVGARVVPLLQTDTVGLILDWSTLDAAIKMFSSDTDRQIFFRKDRFCLAMIASLVSPPAKHLDQPQIEESFTAQIIARPILPTACLLLTDEKLAGVVSASLERSATTVSSTASSSISIADYGASQSAADEFFIHLAAEYCSQRIGTETISSMNSVTAFSSCWLIFTTGTILATFLFAVILTFKNHGRFWGCASAITAFSNIVAFICIFLLPYWLSPSFRFRDAVIGLSAPKLSSGDIEWVVMNARYPGMTFGTLIEHVRYASYRLSFVDQSYLSNADFRNYVLSPRIVHSSEHRFVSSRRTLWDVLLPRVAGNGDSYSAAKSIVYFLRGRVSVERAAINADDIVSLWSMGRTDKKGFLNLYIASLRSVGIPARFSVDDRVEILVENTWIPAPAAPVYSLP